ncbi:MAG: tRNA pseudouridine(13) synthase TruD [Planctomycetes bacterium]|nr:tRNA pseudouridine(13) synthase TruD [Planctomycetota bacterium]
MKIKQKPEDFQVHEINDFSPLKAGKFFVYRLEKRGLSTIECLKILQRKFRLKSEDLQVCGLKDKHSISSQLVSSKRELSEETNNNQFSLEFIGKSDDRVGSDNHKGNKFIITVRDIFDAEVESARKTIKNLSEFGIVNYFDDQRFGSVRHGNEFIAKCLIEKEYEKACRIFMTATSSADKSRDRRRRKDIEANWGDFAMLDKKYGYCEEKPLLHHLKKKTEDWLGALLKINHHLRHILLYSYQSFIWNKTTSIYLNKLGIADLNIEYLLGRLNFYESPEASVFDTLRIIEIPIIRHNTQIENEELRAIYEDVLAEEGLTIQKFRIRSHPAFYFKEYLRKLVIVPENLEIIDVGSDDLNKDMKFVTLKFELPPGAYATLILKRIFKTEKNS